MKKLASLLLSGALARGLRAGGAAPPGPANPPAANTDTPAAPTQTGSLEGTTLKVGASPAPHAEILAVVKELLAEEGINLEIVEFTDYIQPNTAVENGSIDANYFQHITYLNNFNAENGTHLVSVADVHYEPFGIYAGKTASLEELQDGAQIGVPNDPTNGGRALLLLQDLGILTLKEGVGLEATEQDIVENPHNVTIKAMEAANLPASLPDLDFAVINGNYASGAGIGDKVLTTEDAESVAAQTYGNVVAVKEGRENDPAVQALVAVLMSGDVQAWIEESYNGVVMPMGAQELDIPEIAEPVTLKVGASPSPHAEILEHVKPLLAEHNVELDIVEFDDYVMPNTGVEDGSLDANYFQHQPYLDDFNAEQSTHIVSVATVHYEPMGIYPGKTASLDVFGK